MILVDCPRCGGSGFTGPETGYDGVCSECGGQQKWALPKDFTGSVKIGEDLTWEYFATYVDGRYYTKSLKARLMRRSSQEMARLAEEHRLAVEARIEKFRDHSERYKCFLTHRESKCEHNPTCMEAWKTL